MRFFASLKLNQYEVGKGYGSNKKNAKNVAARLALTNLVPTLYSQWQKKNDPKIAHLQGVDTGS
jgi:hypothetical protein